MADKNQGLRIVLTGGGSGGHVIPALALLPQLKRQFSEIYYVGGCGIERRLAGQAGLPYYEIRTAGYARRSISKNIKVPFVLLSAVRDCKRYFKRIKPDIVFGKGGYVSLPPVIAARLLKIPVVCHESDLTTGLANKLAVKFGATLLTGFRECAALNEKYIYTGFPVRQSVLSGNRANAAKAIGLSGRKTILVTGGSLGSEALNNILQKSLLGLLREYDIVHITGENKCDFKTMTGYFPVPYSDNIGDLYAAADVVISRCGAGALMEISSLKKRAVFIPLPKAASRGDQLQNAQIALSHGAQVLLQEGLTPDDLINAVYRARPMTPVADIGNTKICSILASFATNDNRPL